ncbi:Predicted nucleic acid-binding protein, contains PIN domain [Nitrosospira sp. Nsp18]|uniref:type II toxin-antitoxin system VapC family toxin n=1 Tax=Nitrosospira sp. Nsp18 TaxID=1855334 RepID=UPI00087E5D58|nr:PIN domain-containing protein [Nitrosospira sp. Nsp18]SDA28152.1 Predicted nucleic acid-binding protein, contains PIN domain [Nitrosospira sp. Nsp18]
MIIFDANILITLVTKKEGDTAHRIAGLIEDLVAAKTKIGIPSPAWAEFLCGTEAATNAIINSLDKRGSIRILPFDKVSAVETALIHRAARFITGRKKGSSTAAWQQIKTDRQILAIAKQHQVTLIYTDDKDMTLEASYLGIETRNTSEIPLKAKQNNLDFNSEKPSLPADKVASVVPTLNVAGVQMGVQPSDGSLN